MSPVMNALRCGSLLQLVAVTVFTCGFVSGTVQLTHLSTVYLPYDVSGPTPLYGYEKLGVEQCAYHIEDRMLYIVGESILHVVNSANPSNLTWVMSQMLPGLDLTDVEVCGDYVAITAHDLHNASQGQLRIYRKYSKGSDASTLQLLDKVMVGSLPDMLQPLPDCQTYVIALESEAYVTANGSVVDPEGGVVIVNYPDGVEGNSSATVKKLDFRHFNNRYTDLEQSGVRFVYRDNNNPFSNDVEPEYVSIDIATSTAYVCLQENNAVAEVDLTRQNITNIYGLGYKEWNFLDASDDDRGIEITYWPIRALYLPDSIKFHQWKGRKLVITANEGDSKEYGNVFDERVRGDELANRKLGDQLPSMVKSALADDAKLGRLQFSAVDGRDQDGTYQAIYTYGGRSFSIWDADNSFALVYDSGHDMEMLTAKYCPHLFNTEGDGIDTRSDNKGPETESLSVGEIGDRLYIFVGNERPGTIVVYSIGNDVSQPQFETIYCEGIRNTGKTMQQKYDARQLHGVDPEDIRYYSAHEGPADFPVLFVTGTVSNTISVLRVNVSGAYPRDTQTDMCPDFGHTRKLDPNKSPAQGPQTAVVFLSIIVCFLLMSRR